MKKIKIFYYFTTLFFLLLCFSGKGVKAEENINIYEGELGFSYTSSNTMFRVWSSSASKIQVVVESDTTITTELVKNLETNVWIGYVAGDLLGDSYSYTVEYSDSTKYEGVIDPYSKFISTEGKSIIYDSSLVNTESWTNQAVELEIRDKNKIIYGIDVSNFTSHSSWNGLEENRGKLLALMQSGTMYNSSSTGFDYVKGLGVTYLELAQINNNSVPYSIDSKLVSGEEAYSGASELKQVINTYYTNGIGVILSFDLLDFSNDFLTNLNKLDNTYYLDSESNLDMSKVMVQKYLIDLLDYWVKEYKLAGIKFENMGSISASLMNNISLSLKEINPSIVLYGDGSYTSVSENNAGENNLNKLDIIKMLNGSLNYALFGDLFDRETKGLLDGNYSKEMMETLKFTFLSSVNNGEIDYSLVQGVSYKQYWNNTSSYQLVTNMGGNEGLSLHDKLFINSLTSENIIKQKIILAFSTMVMSGGIPYIYSGNEFLITYLDASKNANNNAICSDGDAFCFYTNKESKVIDWGYASTNSDTVNSIKSLINFRKSNSAIIQDDASVISKNVKFFTNDDFSGVIGFTRNYPNAYTRQVEKAFAVFNYSNDEVVLKDLDSKNWYGLYTLNLSIRDGDSIILKPMSLYVEAKEKRSNVSPWISLLIIAVLLGGMYTLNIFLSKKLVEKKGYDIKQVKRKYRPFIKNKKGKENSETSEEKNKDE